MSIYSNRYLAFLGLLAIVTLGGCNTPGQLPTLSQAQRDWLATQIFQNECNSNYHCLTSWNPGEEFPSLGIGHFIWYRQGQSEPFVEGFPQLLQAYSERDIALPDWLAPIAHIGSPWQDRSEFQAQLASAEMEQLRQLLAQTMSVQIDLIIARLYDALPALLNATAAEQQALIQRRFYQLANSQPPMGIYALVDYVNFKGEGIASSERYGGQGWGLLQVLEALPAEAEDGSILQDFVTTASAVLALRVDNAPPARDEQRWLAGWNNRLQTYLPQ